MENQLVKVLVNFVGNYFKSGPDTDEKNGIAAVADTPIGAGIFIDGNVIEYRDGTELTGIHVVEPNTRWYLVQNRFPAAPITTVSAQEAYSLVLADSGSNRGLNCDGSFFWRRDAIDDRIINDVKNTTGRIIDSPSQVGGWLKLDPGTPCLDTDHDGMPDAWEQSYGLNPDSAADNILDADGHGSAPSQVSLSLCRGCHGGVGHRRRQLQPILGRPRALLPAGGHSARHTGLGNPGVDGRERMV
jgi:hypothetical protein